MSAALPTWHEGLVYRSTEEYVDGMTAFLHGALEEGRPAFAAVPGDHRRLLVDAMGSRAAEVRWADMQQVGRNPNRIMPAIRAFVDEHAGTPVSFIGEPIWGGRTRAEIAEATRHEALINHALVGSGARVLCPYDASALAPEVVADSRRTHPRVWEDGDWLVSEDYVDPVVLWREIRHLPEPPADAETLLVQLPDLPQLRARAARIGADAGLPDERRQDLMLIVTELASNSLRHAGEPGVVTLWRDDDAVVGQVDDGGRVADVLAGRVAPDLEAAGGRGLWLVNCLSDLVQLHSDERGTLVRFRVR